MTAPIRLFRSYCKFLLIHRRKEYEISLSNTPLINKFRWHYPPRPDYNIKYPAPMVLKGSGGVVVDTQSTYRASFPLPAFSFDNNGCSVGMWLLLTDIAETVDFEMRLRGFSLVITLTERSVEVICSHAGGLRAQAKTKVPYYRWFHFMITYSSTFLLHIHGNVYALTCTEGPLSADQLSERTLTTEYDEHLFLSYTGYIKYNSQARFADIQALPCALTACEIAAVVAQSTCIEKLDMGNYLINRWTNLPWYRRYTPRCVLF